MIGSFLHNPCVNRRDLAQIKGHARRQLVFAQSSFNLVFVGEAAIPATFAQHLFRTPSPGGQDPEIFGFLPAIFCSFSKGKADARQSACRWERHGFRLLRHWQSGWLDASSFNNVQRRHTCIHLNWYSQWRSRAACLPAGIRSENRRSSGARPVRALPLCWTGMSRPARLSALRQTFCTVRKTPVSAEPSIRALSGRRPSAIHFQTLRTVRSPQSAHGFSRDPLLKTKDVPCSTRS